MFKTVLVPTDGSPLSEKAAATAIEFAKIYGSSIIALSVAETYPVLALAETSALTDPATFQKGLLEVARQRVQKIAEAARQAGVPCETVVTQSPEPHEEILNTANQHQCDAIFMASHGRRGLSRLFIGSETQKVLSNSTIPVLVIR